MAEDVDDGFYKRADAHIDLSNNQLQDAGRGKVSASMMYSLARFNAWISACELESPEQMIEAREQTVEYFTAEYRRMLEENFNDYITHFNQYMESGK